MQYLWSDEAQREFVKFYFRSVTNETLNQENKALATIKEPFTVNDPLIGGWSHAYPEIIEGIFRDQVQKRK
jgi:ABC-type sulfate transport system substrate-binding protein